MHLGSFKRTLQDDKKNKHLVNRRLPYTRDRSKKVSLLVSSDGQVPYLKFILGS